MTRNYITHKRGVHALVGVYWLSGYCESHLTRTIIPNSNSTTYGLKSLKHEGNKIWNQLAVDIKTSEILAIFKIKINK